MHKQIIGSWIITEGKHRIQIIKREWLRKGNNYAASGATLEFPVPAPCLCSGSLQSLTFLIELHVLSINLSNDVNFFREKSSLHAGIGAKVTPAPPTGLASDCELQN